MDVWILSFAWAVICLLLVLLTRAGLHRRLSVVEQKTSSLEEVLNMHRAESEQRHLAMVSVITRTVRSSLLPITERLDKQDREMSEIKDMCAYLVNERKIDEHTLQTQGADSEVGKRDTHEGSLPASR